MKLLLSLVLLLPLISSCGVYEGVKAEETISDLDKQETKVQDEMERVQGELDRVEREVKAQKKTAN